MSKTRKILSVVLALAMVFSVLSVSASAAASYESAEDLAEFDYNQEWELVERSNDGTTWVVDVVLTTNYPTGSIQFVVNNTNPAAAVLDYENVELGAGIEYDADIKASANGKVLIVPATTADTVTAPELDGAVVATLKYTYAGTGSATLTIANAPKKADSPAGTLIAARMDDGDIVTGTPVVGQPATVSGEVIIGTAAESELVVKAGTNGVIDDTRMCVYGIDVMDAGQAIGDVFEVTNGGSIEVTPSNEGVEEGTGAILVAKNAAGDVIGEYTVVIHGDVNGDGSSDSLDATILSEFEVGSIADFSAYGISDDVAMVAGDVNADGGADSLDATILSEFEVGLTDVLFDITSLPQELLALA